MWGDLCREKRVNIAYTNYPRYFEMDAETQEMVKYQGLDGLDGVISHDWQILDSFFNINDIVPVWTNCHGIWGVYDEEARKWSGAVGKVRRRKA